MGVRGWDEDGGWGYFVGVLLFYFGRTSRFRGIGVVFFRMWDETSWLENGSSNWLMNSELDVW